MKNQRLATLFIALSGFLLLTGNSAAEQQSADLWAIWVPDLNQTIQQLEAALEEAEQQQEMNYRIANLAAAYDAELYILYHELIHRLKATGSDQAVEQSLAEQRQWLSKRERQQEQAAAEYQGGTLASYSAGEAYVAATKKRIAAVKARMDQVSAAGAGR